MISSDVSEEKANTFELYLGARAKERRDGLPVHKLAVLLIDRPTDAHELVGSVGGHPVMAAATAYSGGHITTTD